MCACWYPRILTSLYPEFHACLLASLHPHILSYTQIPMYLVVFSRPHILMSYSQVFVCLLVFSHPHNLRFIRTCWYSCILISSDSCVFPFILASSYPQIHVCFLLSLHSLILIFLCIVHFANKYLHKYT